MQKITGRSYQITRLDNGLRVATSFMPQMKSVSIGVWFGCGSRYEEKRTNGISHFIEHLVFKGTEKRSGDEICEAIEGFGGELNASTSEESTEYFVKTIREEVQNASEIVLDMVLNPSFKPGYLEKQRDIIVEEIHMCEDNPSSHVEDLFNALIWKDNPLGFTVLGSIANIKNISRDDIIAYKQRMYCANNCVVAAAGDIEHTNFVGMVRKNTENLNRGAPSRFKPVRNTQLKPALVVENKDTEQVHLILGVPAVKWADNRRYALKLISIILGENMSSRLFKTVREEQGLVYSIQSGIDRYIDTGAFYVSAGIVTEQIIKAIKIILSEMAELKKTTVPKKELDRAKQYFRGSIIMDSERTMSRLHWLGENLRMADRIYDIEETINAVMNVTADDIKHLAETIFINQRLNAALIGPIKNSNAIKKILKFD